MDMITIKYERDITLKDLHKKLIHKWAINECLEVLERGNYLVPTSCRWNLVTLYPT